MLPYWVLLLIPMSLAASDGRTKALTGRRWSLPWRLMFMLLVLAIGMRHEVGGDWSVYLEQIIDANDLKPSDLLVGTNGRGDPAYHLLNWIAAQLHLGPYFVNTICAAVFTWGLLEFCRAQPRGWLALVVAMPYLVIVVAMGYTRQSVAIGLSMLALVALSEQKLRRFVLFVAIAAAFHKTAAILMPIAMLAASHKRLWTIAWVGLVSVFFYGLFLQESMAKLAENYLETGYDSSGAAIRVAMNAAPAVLFLVFRSRFFMADSERRFWTWMSLGGIAFVPMLVLLPSSTAVDRLALYWIPLQLFVFSRIPDALGRRYSSNAAWIWLVMAYSATVLFVWLVFAAHAFAWLPYQFYPWVMLWQ